MERRNRFRKLRSNIGNILEDYLKKNKNSRTGKLWENLLKNFEKMLKTSTVNKTVENLKKNY